ncbi:LOW QUALITY PROTEIN: hypothetical protein CFC21_005540 [Triticum aestivum]|uniref:BTB domain-containing protein n=2 Tax=Triticum aestivum TaxID=4565 RepID=A0A9R1IPI1_WHEAT|nr:LOW QUALITY PROTEIN: hypothetical protein CFC21_005540 [Triticum aestivum]
MAEICNLPAANVVSSQGSSYVIKIDEYSRIKGQSERGKYVKSTPFSVGGHDWVVWYFPNEPVGSYNKTAEHIFPSKGSDWGFSNFIKKANEGSMYLRKDSLRIMCDVTVVKYGHKANRLSLVPPSNLHQHLGELLKSRDGADVTFHVGGESFLAHRAVLAARSSVFKAELFGAMKEDADRPTEISDMEPDMTNGGKARRDAVMAGHLLVVADRYYIERLKVFCEEKLCKLLQHKSRRLKEACFQFLASLSNLKAMMASDGYEHLKNSCPSVLKELAVSFLPAELKAVKDHCILSILVSISSTIATAKVPISYFFCNIEEIFPDFFI